MHSIGDLQSGGLWPNAGPRVNVWSNAIVVFGACAFASVYFLVARSAVAGSFACPSLISTVQNTPAGHSHSPQGKVGLVDGAMVV